MLGVRTTLTAAAPTAAASAAPEFTEVRDYISENIASRKFPSIAVAVSRHGRTVWEEAFGFADKEKQITATPHTLYHLASVTKTFTTAAMMKLVEQGDLKLDHPINNYLGQAKLSSPKWNPTEVTVRQVATHTAGLTTYDQACFSDEPDCDPSYETMLKHYGVLFWKPGSRFDYSNLGYGVLSAAIEHVSGKRFGDFLRDEIFAPLEMTEAIVGTRPDIATPYDKDGTATAPHRSVAEGATSASSSASSLLKFAMFNLKHHSAGRNAVLSDTTIDAMHNETVPTDEPGQRYGLGWWVNENQHGYRVLYDGGGTVDSKALLYTIPSEDIAVVVLSNGPALDADKIVDRIFAALLSPYAEDVQRSQAPSATSSPAPSPPRSPDWVRGTLAGFVHTYDGNKPLTVTMDDAGKGSVTIGSNSPVPIERFRLLGSNGLVVRARARLGISDAEKRQPYTLGFELYREGDTLYGATTTWSQPGARDGGLLSYFVTLARPKN